MNRKAILRNVARAGFALFGILGVVLLVRNVGAAQLLALLRGALPWVPALLALELVRIAAEGAATTALLHHEMRGIRKVGKRALLRMHLVANAALVVLPGGRAISEGLLASYLAPSLGTGHAVAVVVARQVATLWALVVISIPCTFAAWWISGFSMLTIAIAIHMVGCVISALLLDWAARHAKLPAFLAKKHAHTTELVDEFREASKHIPWIHGGALIGKVVNRLAQAVQYGVLLYAVGSHATIARAFVADGVNLVGSALGEVIPAQAGATDGAFALAASALAIPVASAVAIATLARLVQLAWSVIGAVLPMVWPFVPRTSADIVHGDQRVVLRDSVPPVPPLAQLRDSVA